MPEIEQDIDLVAALRTPIGKFGGALSALTAAQLGTESAKATLARSEIDPVFRKDGTVHAGNSSGRDGRCCEHAHRERRGVEESRPQTDGAGLSMIVERV
jgi:acetyl-CoA C-acetyltransferase